LYQKTATATTHDPSERPTVIRFTAVLAATFAFVACALPPPAFADAAALQALLERNAAAISRLQADHLAELAAMADAPAVHEYFLAPADKRAGKLAGVKAALAGRQTGSELCLIDNHGSEHLRAVHGRLAGDTELAHDEVDAPFFAAAMALPQGASYVSEPYLSPDVEEWVIGFVVPVIPGEAILHFEHSLREYQGALAQGGGEERSFVLAIDHAGNIVADSRHAVATRMVPGKDTPRAYFENLFKGADALPPAVAAVIASGGKVGAGRVAWGGHDYLLAHKTLRGLSLVAFERQAPSRP
jgi:hypothetical protein